MNKLKGFIKNIDSSENMSIVEISIEKHSIYSIIVKTLNIENSIKIGKEMFAVFKETEVFIIKNFQGKISLRNQLDCEIKSIEEGKLLSKVEMDFINNKIVSIISTTSLKELDLKIGDKVKAFIKMNEISLMEI